MINMPFNHKKDSRTIESDEEKQSVVDVKCKENGEIQMKQINVKVDEETFQRLKKIKDKWQFTWSGVLKHLARRIRQSN